MRRRVNLLPKESRDKVEIPVEKLLIFGFALTILFYLSSYGIFKYKIKSTNRNIASLNAVLSKKEKTLSLESLKENDINSEFAKAKIISNIIGDKSNWSGMFKELSLIIPAKAWLEHFKVESKDGRQDYLIQGKAAAQEVMASFFGNLESSFYFKDIKLNSSEKIEDIYPNLYAFSFGSGKLKSDVDIKGKKEKSVTATELMKKEGK